VILDENGAQLANVAELNFSVEANGVARGSIEVLGIKTNVSNVAIEEVTFVCPLCQDRSEHTCDTRLGGGSPTIQHTSLQFAPNGMASIPPPVYAISWVPCGRTWNNGMHDLTCIVNEDIHHQSHFDGEHGISWTGA
jgi:hypothetical protein